MENDGTDATTDAPVVRQQHFDCAGPVEVWVDLEGGELDVRLSADTADAGTVAVQVKPCLKARARWSVGITGILTWLGEQAGAGPSAELTAEAIRSTVIDFAEQRLTVQTPRESPLRSVPLAIQVTAPSGSSVIARSASADLTVDGVADRLEATTGSGQIRVQRCSGAVDVRTGSGAVRLGSVLGRLWVRTGSGLVDVVSLEQASNTADNAGTVQTGSGDVRFGAVARDVTAHTGTGDLSIVDASAGDLELTSGSGQLRVGIHPGVLAELDVSSGFGRAHSDLPVGGPPTEGEVGLRLRARTGSGDALITAAPR
ncbi:MAG: DUF4097 domain-containing protein [Pseudonocardiaceae bacterium]